MTWTSDRRLRCVSGWLCTLACQAALAAGAPAPSLYYPFQAPADILVNSVLIPSSPTVATYYSTLGWNVNAEGGGYAGLQWTSERVAGGGPAFIFSLWDPITPSGTITTDHLGPGAETRRFDGEGTGLNSMNWTLGWKADVWYTTVVRRWDCQGGTRTCFGLWILKEDENRWTHHITMVYPVPGVTFVPGIAAFLEDFQQNGLYRSVRLKNAFARLLDGRWSGLDQPYFNASTENPYVPIMPNAYNGFTQADYFVMEAGQGVSPSRALGSVLPRASMPASPGFPAASIATFQATVSPALDRVTATWSVAADKSPQFGYRMQLFRDGQASPAAELVDTLPQARSATMALPGPGSYRVALEIVDLFDQVSATASTTVAAGSAPGPAPQCTLSATPSNIQAGQPVTLQATCNPPATTFEWANAPFGSGSSGGVVTPSVTTSYSVRGFNAMGGGNTANVTVSVSTANPGMSYTGLWWNPAESGWGINFNHQGNIVFGTLFTYHSETVDGVAEPQWVVMPRGERTHDECFAGTLYRTTGPAFNSMPFRPITPENLTDVGYLAVCFSGDTADLQYRLVSGSGPVYQNISKTIHKQVFGARAAQCDFTFASRSGLSNYQDLWWNAAESGWGVNVTHQDNTIFATLFTYRADGQGVWLVMSNGDRQSDGSYSGDLFQTKGPPFHAQPFTPIGPQNLRKVGSMRFNFSDGENGTLSYSLDGASVMKSITRQVFSSPVSACRAPAPSPPQSPIAGTWHGDGLDATAVFGGAPYCTYRVTMRNLRLSTTVTPAGAIGGASLAGTMTEEIVGSCQTSATFGTQANSWSLAAGSTSGNAIDLQLGGASNSPRSEATFSGSVASSRLTGTLIIRRTDQLGNLNWVLTTEVR